MSGFLNELCYSTRKGCDGYYILHDDLVYKSDLLDREIIVPAGFETDLASVPRIPFVYMLWGDRVHREAVVHDYLYREDSIPVVSKSVANKIFLEAIKCRNNKCYVSYPMYFGVCIGGGFSYHNKKVGDKICDI